MSTSVYVVVLNRALELADGDKNRLAEVLRVPVDVLSLWLREEGAPDPAQVRAALDYIADKGGATDA